MNPLKPNDRNIIECESPMQAYAHWKTLRNHDTMGSNLSWFNNESEALTGQRCTNGDASVLPAAQALMGRLSPGWTAPAIQMVPEVHGAFPVVPEYLAGEPECMRTLVAHADASAPIRLFVDLTCSAGIQSKDMLTRGTTIIALALTLQQIRPLDLYAFCTMEGNSTKENPRVKACGMMVKLDLQGSLMAQSLYALSSTGFSRRVIYDAMTPMGFEGNWADYSAFKAGHGRTSSKEYIRACRWHLSLNPEDILIPGISLFDDTTTNPDKWLQKMLGKIEKHLQGSSES